MTAVNPDDPATRIVVDVKDLTLEFREDLERSFDANDGWDQECVDRVVTRHYGFLGPHVKGWVDPAADKGEGPAGLLVVEFMPPKDRDENEAALTWERAVTMCAEGLPLRPHQLLEWWVVTEELR